MFFELISNLNFSVHGFTNLTVQGVSNVVVGLLGPCTEDMCWCDIFEKYIIFFDLIGQ